MASTTAKAAQEVLAADFQALVEDAEKLLEHSATLAGDQADVLRAQVRESLARARASLHETEQVVLDRSREAVDATEAWVQTKPMQAVGIAAGLGFLIGLMATRR